MTPAPALVITRDDLLLDDLLRLAAAAGVSLDVAHDTTSALRGWSAAAVVLVGSDLVDRVAEQRPPRREQVHVVGHAPTGDTVFRHALLAGAADVVELPAAEGWLVELLTDVTDAVPGSGRRGRIVGVVAGSGGVGASMFAAALAVSSSLQQATALVDLDPLGPGLGRVVGLDDRDGAGWDVLVSSRGRLGSRSLRSALPDKDGLAVLTWGAGPVVDLEPTAVREVLSAAQRGHDLVVVDLPRRLDPVSEEVVTRCDQVLLVVGPTVVGVASAGRVLARLRPLTDRVSLVTRRGGATVEPDQVASALGVPVAAELPRQRRLDEHVELGLGPVHSRRSGLARAARATLARVAGAGLEDQRRGVA
jgi:secretion/DNA translocation related CpaE-like protein